MTSVALRRAVKRAGQTVEEFQETTAFVVVSFVVQFVASLALPYFVIVTSM